jgi:formylglycine-generating enzyme required for sulfatase activity
LARFPLPAPGTPVLVLGDLGCNDRPAHRRQRWLRFGARLKRAGCPPAALTPCPPRRWDGELARLFDLACWDRTARLPRQRGRAAGGGPGLGEDAADTLLALLSPAIRVEPGLLRAARLLLPAGQADVGAEASAWNHADVHAMPTAFYYEPEAQAGHRLRFQAGFEPRVKQALARQLAAHHACLSPFIAHEEAMVLAELLGAEALAQAWPKALADAEAWQRRLAKTCAGDGPLAEAAQAWVGRLAARAQPENLWPAHEALEAAWVLAHREALVQGRVDALPTGLSLNRVAWALGGQGQAGAWVLRQVGGALHAEPVGGAGAALSALGGVPVVNLEAAAPYAMLAVIDESAVIAELADFLHPRPDAITPLSTLLSLIHPLPSAGSPPPKPMPLARPIPLPEAARFRLATDREDWLFDQIDKPDWASGIGRDRQGLYADVQAGAERLRLYWQPGEAGYSAALHVPGTWGGFESLGRDGFGLWADLALYVWREMGCEDSVETPLSYFNRIVQRFRRIAPGRFWMGSPEYEWERFGDETRHEVTLTRGFWLADSACTQAFWQAVTGSNPSRFHDGPDKPVENVSWHDVQGFIARLNEAVPGLAARLPSEAEWEYACRAGTKTPFSFGKSITPEQVNYDGNSPYAGGKKGVYRVKTVPVKCLPPNAWGLHEMHGNVWEWCQDWYARYGLVAQTNPVGPLEGVGRVLRGGSWISYGRRLRSANRHGGGPDTHLDDVGFRLTLGPTSR